MELLKGWWGERYSRAKDRTIQAAATPPQIWLPEFWVRTICPGVSLSLVTFPSGERLIKKRRASISKTRPGCSVKIRGERHVSPGMAPILLRGRCSDFSGHPKELFNCINLTLLLKVKYVHFREDVFLGDLAQVQFTFAKRGRGDR